MNNDNGVNKICVPEMIPCSSKGLFTSSHCPIKQIIFFCKSHNTFGGGCTCGCASVCGVDPLEDIFLSFLHRNNSRKGWYEVLQGILEIKLYG